MSALCGADRVDCTPHVAGATAGDPARTSAWPPGCADCRKPDGRQSFEMREGGVAPRLSSGGGLTLARIRHHLPHTEPGPPRRRRRCRLALQISKTSCVELRAERVPPEPPSLGSFRNLVMMIDQPPEQRGAFPAPRDLTDDRPEALAMSSHARGLAAA